MADDDKSPKVPTAETRIQDVPNIMDPFQGVMKDPPVTGCGPCEVTSFSWRNLETNLVQSRYGSVFHNWVLSGGNLVLAKSGDSPVAAFTAGVTDKGDDTGLIPAGTPLTRAETDAYVDGALGTNIASNYRITGMQIDIGVPFLAGVSISGDASARQSLPALEFYAARMMRFLLKNTTIRFRYGQSTSGAYELGRAEFWPQSYGPTGDGLPSNGTPIARLFLPIRLPTWAGGPTDDNALEVDVVVNHALQMVADPLVPIPALAAGAAYLQPMTIKLNGEPRVSQPVTAANVEKMIEDKIAAVVGGAGGGLDAMIQRAVSAALARR